eukprot:4691831-Pleurochrysis_carterae.AAC.1
MRGVVDCRSGASEKRGGDISSDTAVHIEDTTKSAAVVEGSDAPAPSDKDDSSTAAGPRPPPVTDDASAGRAENDVPGAGEPRPEGE